jgi:hypothetical protein
MTLTIRGQVRGGRLLVDEPIDLPDGCEVALAVVEDGDDLDDDDRARFTTPSPPDQAQMDRGEGIAAGEVVAMLRAKHG